MTLLNSNCDIPPSATLWELYAATLFVTAHPLPWRGRFGIVTAVNPGSLALSAGANRIRDRALQAQLVASGRPFVEIWGCSPDLRYRERSWAVWAEMADIIDLGRRHEQSAVFFVDDDRLWLVSCAGEGPQPRELGAFSERLVAE